MKKNEFGFIDLCCGAGGFSYGMKKAGWKPLLGIDACNKSLETFAANVSPRTLQVDLLSRNAESSIRQYLAGAKVDAVVAGPPCQGFSQAGRRDPRDPRNRVFVACARLAIALRPKLILFENVPYIAKKPFNVFLKRAISVFKKSGYDVRVFEVEAEKIGIAQRRKRLFVAAFKGIPVRRVDAAIRGLLDVNEPSMTVREAWKGLPSKCSKRSRFRNHEPMIHSVKVQKKIARILPGSGPLSYRKLHPDMPALTLIAGHSAAPCHFKVNRTITVREAARIQSFKDTFVFKGGKRSELLQVANAVPPRLAYLTGKRFLRALRG